MDVLAERLGMSPLELRRKNLLRDGDRFATGEVMHDVHFEDCLQAAADAVGYEDDPRGKGLCVLLKGMQTPSRAAIIGASARRSATSCARRRARWARASGARSSSWPPSCSAASRGRSSCPTRHRQLAVRHPHDLQPLDAHDGPRADRSGRRPASQRRRGGLRRGARRGRPGPRHRAGHRLHRTGTRAPPRAQVDVDEETGQLTVEQLHGVAYAGRVVNRAGAELQNEGSLIMGLGTALFEAIDFGDGQVANANLSDYNVPAPGDLPAALHATSSSSATAPRSHGLGETVAAAGARGHRQRARSRSACTSASCRSPPSACSTPSTRGTARA